MRWNVAADGYKAFCPHCGKRLMLCDACQHPEDKCVENCDYNSETDTCRHNQPAQELKAGDVCTYGFGTENASRATVKIVELLPRSEAATVRFLSVERDDTGNGMFNYLLKTGNTMNASLKYLTKIECSSDQERDNYAELEKLCTECDTEFCVFNPHGICKLPFVTGKAPRLGDATSKEQMRDLALTLLEAYSKMEEPDMCEVDVSVDMFHEAFRDNDNAKILSGLSFFGQGKQHSVKDDDLNWLLNTGRANKNGIGVRAPEVLRTDMDELVTDYSTEYNSIAFDTLYIAANGNVVDGCDSSYEDIDDEENVICKVNQLQKKVKDYVKNADSQIS